MVQNDGIQQNCFVGLDGVPHSLLKVFELQVMPFLGELAAQGVYVVWTQVYTISSVAWTSFMTVRACNHGIFVHRCGQGRNPLELPSFDDIKTLWSGTNIRETIDCGQSSFHLSCQTIEWQLIAGFVSPIFERQFTHNPWFHGSGLQDINWYHNVRARQNRAFLVDDLFATLRYLKKSFSSWFRNRGLFIFVVRGQTALIIFFLTRWKIRPTIS